MVLRRRELRMQVLMQLYEHHHQSGGQDKVVHSELDIERALACRFLVEKGYAREMPAVAGDAKAMSRLTITHAGIEYVEQRILERAMSF